MRATSNTSHPTIAADQLAASANAIPRAAPTPAITYPPPKPLYTSGRLAGLMPNQPIAPRRVSLSSFGFRGSSQNESQQILLALTNGTSDGAGHVVRRRQTVRGGTPSAKQAGVHSACVIFEFLMIRHNRKRWQRARDAHAGRVRGKDH